MIYKLRVWHPDNGEMHYLGDVNDITSFHAGDHYRDMNQGSVTWMLYTGRLDDDQNEIYDGDLLELQLEGKTIGRVDYSSSLAAWIVIHKSGFELLSRVGPNRVIGNIHQQHKTADEYGIKRDYR